MWNYSFKWEIKKPGKILNLFSISELQLNSLLIWKYIVLDCDSVTAFSHSYIVPNDWHYSLVSHICHTSL